MAPRVASAVILGCVTSVSAFGSPATTTSTATAKVMPSAGEVINMINNMWRAFEFGYRDEFIAVGTSATKLTITPNSFNGMADLWDNFRAGLGAGETHWMYCHNQHRVDLATRTVTYSLSVVMKNPFSFPWVNLTQGTLVANGMGVMTFDENWLLATMWQDAFVDVMLGDVDGHWPSTNSPYSSNLDYPAIAMLSADTTDVGLVINAINDMWRAFEYGIRDQWIQYGTDYTLLTITPNSFVGMAALWDDFRAGLGTETHWQYQMVQHRIDMSARTATYSLRVIMKAAFSFPWVNLTAGTLVANGQGVLTYDSSWKLATLWQDAYVDVMLGDTDGRWPSGSSVYIPVTSIKPLAALSSTPTVAEVINQVNNMWRAFEFGYRSEWIACGTATTQITITPNSFIGMSDLWDNFRAGLGSETHWQYMDFQHRVDLAGKSVTYNLQVIMKAPFSFPWVNLTQGTLVANGIGVLTYDDSWLLASLWQDAYVDVMLGDTDGRWPSGNSPYLAMSAIGTLPSLTGYN